MAWCVHVTDQRLAERAGDAAWKSQVEVFLSEVVVLARLSQTTEEARQIERKDLLTVLENGQDLVSGERYIKGPVGHDIVRNDIDGVILM
jgi:hypothetical protein